MDIKIEEKKSYCRLSLFIDSKENSLKTMLAKRDNNLMTYLFCSAQERLSGIYEELGGANDGVPIYLLFQHPVMRDCIHMCKKFKLIVSILMFFFNFLLFIICLHLFIIVEL